MFVFGSWVKVIDEDFGNIIFVVVSYVIIMFIDFIYWVRVLGFFLGELWE